MATRNCTKCGKNKDITLFVKDNTRKCGYTRTCKDCKNLHHRKTHPPSTKKQIQEKKEKTWLKKYGVDNPSKLSQVRRKAESTTLERYGVPHAAQSPEILKKSKKTCIEKYGVPHPQQSKTIKNKTTKTNLKKYGKEYIFQSEIIKEKIKNSIIKNYKVDNVSKAQSIKDKKRKTSLSNYGVNHPRQSKIYLKELTKKQIKEDKLLNLTINGTKKSISEASREYNKSYDRTLNIYKLFGSDAVINWLINSKSNIRSSYEDTLLSIIKSKTNLKIHTNNRSEIKPLELDLFIPEKKLAIEVNGSYYHSSLFVDKNYHKIKADLAEKRGIKLLQFYDTDIDSKLDIISSMVLSSLGVCNSIYARKCTIRNISSKEHSIFMSHTHLQGPVTAKIRLGLFYEDNLVCCMSFSKSRFSNSPKKDSYELLRYSTKLNTRVVGGASKLLSYFLKNYSPNEVISYCDRDYSSGNLYSTLGFKMEKILPPSYFYFKHGKRYNRIGFQKHKLKDKLEKFDINLSEKENMINNGYLIIYTSGNKKYTLTYKQ